MSKEPYIYSMGIDPYGDEEESNLVLISTKSAKKAQKLDILSNFEPILVNKKSKTSKSLLII